MKQKLYTVLTILLAATGTFAACGPGQSEIIVVIVPDAFPSEIHWSLRYASNNALIDTGNAVGDTVCVNSGQCVRFTMYDGFGDGIYSPGYYQVKLNGLVVAQGGQNYTYTISHYINCPPGTSCADPFTITSTGSYTAPQSDTWYRFVADTTGNFRFSTCNTNTCDTRIYGYDHCVGIMYDDAVLGVAFYNDDFCGIQSQVDYGIAEGDTVWVRIGDNGTACGSSPINWTVEFTGPVVGCMDPAACNYNPLATVADTNCVYSGPLCQGPDLMPDFNQLWNSVSINNNHMAQTCEVQEGCIQGYGTRQLVYYGVQIWNIGTQPYWPGTPNNNPNGYEWAPCHGHYHYKGFANSYLFDENFVQVDFARKTSYAIVNMGCSTTDPPLAAGCYDTYGAGYACQWVDVTDLEPGLYHLVLKINPDHLPDYIGRTEINYANNATQICFQLIDNGNGTKSILKDTSNCPVFTDCLGVPYGSAVMDCNGDCNGTRIRGDLNIDSLRSITDVHLYLQQTANENINPILCNELTGDTTYTVYDAARLNGCLRSQDSTHFHPGGYSGNHAHCNFPFGINNMFDSVYVGLTNLQNNYVDVTIQNANGYLLAGEFTVNGLVVDSVKSIFGNFSPRIEWSSSGHVSFLCTDEFALNKNYSPAAVLRIYFSQQTENIICIQRILDVVNSNYERANGFIGDCVESLPSAIQQSAGSPISLQIVPNPSRGRFELILDGGMLRDAHIQVLNQLGETVLTETVNSGSNRHHLALENAATGVYTVRVLSGRYNTENRLVIIQ